MKRATANQADLFQSEGAPSETGTQGEEVASVGYTPPSSSGTLELPTFGRQAQTYAETARIAGRLNASTVSEQEHEAWLRERQELLQKELYGNLSRKEAVRL